MEKYLFQKSGEELCTELAKKVGTFQDFALRSGLCHVWNKNRAFYEGRVFGNSITNDIIDTGSVGEQKAMSFHHFRNIIRHQLNGISSKEPAYEVSSINADLDSRRSSRLGDDLVVYYYKTKRAKKYMARTLEKALVYGEGYITCEFDPSLGRVITVDEKGRLMREGDFRFASRSPFDTYYDYTKECFEDWEWAQWRYKRNRYDLAALFPAKKDQILGLDCSISKDGYSDFLRDSDYEEMSNDVYVYATYHKATNALPSGKYVLWAGDKEEALCLYEGDNPYREDLPIFQVSPAHYMETSFGFTEANILRPAQMALTLAVSAMLTNMEAGKLMNIWTNKGSDMSVEEIAEGMNLLQSDAKPEVLDFYRENPGLVNMLGLCINTMETLSGQNSVIRGNVKDTPNLKSGVALATVINQAQEYSQALEQSYFEVFEDLFTFLLKTLKNVANEERLFEIAGRGRRSSVLSFTKKDLEGFSRVIIHRVNPISKTPAGQIEIAMELLKLGQITPEQFFEVMDTGKLEVATQSDERLLDYIQAVKERLLEGGTVTPVPGINHRLFIQEIQSLLYDLDLTTNPEKTQIVENIITLVNAHMELVRNGDEISALIFGGNSPTPNQISNEELETVQSSRDALNPMQSQDPGAAQSAKPLI